MGYGEEPKRRRVRPGVHIAARILVVLFLLTLAGCAVGGFWAYRQGYFGGLTSQPQPTSVPVVVATATPVPVQPTASLEEPATPTPEPVKPTAPPKKPTATKVPATKVPVTEVPVTAVPSVEPTPTLPEFKCVIANYPGYYILPWMLQGGFDEKWGFRLKVIPMSSGPKGEDFAYSEDEQAELLRSGQIDCLLTTHDTFRQGKYGEAIIGVDMSRGADLFAAEKAGLKFNDLIGKPIAVALNSVSEYFTIVLFRIIGADPADPNVRVTVPGIERAEQALEAFREGKAAAVVAWVPVIYADGQGNVFADIEVEVSPGVVEVQSVQVGYKVIDSARIPAILDVVVVSNQAIEQLPEVVQAFTDAWFDALDQMFQNPERAANAIIEWDRANYGWTGLEAYASDMGYTPGEALIDYMWGIAQAGLWPNVVLMQDHASHEARDERGILARHIDYALDIWRSGGVPVRNVNSIEAINSTFVLETYRRHSRLLSKAQPLFTDYPFVLHGEDPLKHIFTEGDIPEMDIIAALPKLTFEFIRDTGTLKPEYEDEFEEYMLDKVKPAMEATSSDVGLICTVGAAWPQRYTKEQIEEFLRETRIKGVSQLMGGTYMVDMTRVVFQPWMPAKRGDVKDEHRFIQCELGALGGR